MDGNTEIEAFRRVIEIPAVTEVYASRCLSGRH